MNPAIQVRRTPDGRIQARRLDGKPLTPEDREEAKLMAVNRTAPIPHPEPIPLDDPIISVDAWYPTFHQMHVAVVAESPDFDYRELKHQNLELYSQIKAAEARIDALEDARLSEVMAIMTEWRGLILKATFEQRQRTAAATRRDTVETQVKKANENASKKHGAI